MIVFETILCHFNSIGTLEPTCKLFYVGYHLEVKYHPPFSAYGRLPLGTKANMNCYYNGNIIGRATATCEEKGWSEGILPCE